MIEDGMRAALRGKERKEETGEMEMEMEKKMADDDESCPRRSLPFQFHSPSLTSP
jgi:hypothetical protein